MFLGTVVLHGVLPPKPLGLEPGCGSGTGGAALRSSEFNPTTHRIAGPCAGQAGLMTP